MYCTLRPPITLDHTTPPGAAPRTSTPRFHSSSTESFKPNTDGPQCSGAQSISGKGGIKALAVWPGLGLGLRLGLEVWLMCGIWRVAIQFSRNGSMNRGHGRDRRD